MSCHTRFWSFLSSVIALQMRMLMHLVELDIRCLIWIPVPGRPTIWIIVGQGPIALAVGTGGGCLDIFTLLCPF